MYVIHASRRTLAFLYGNLFTAGAVFSGGSRMGTTAPVQHPF